MTIRRIDLPGSARKAKAAASDADGVATTELATGAGATAVTVAGSATLAGIGDGVATTGFTVGAVTGGIMRAGRKGLGTGGAVVRADTGLD
jgi:hypothetical protein